MLHMLTKGGKGKGLGSRGSNGVMGGEKQLLSVRWLDEKKDRTYQHFGRVDSGVDVVLPRSGQFGKRGEEGGTR